MNLQARLRLLEQQIQSEPSTPGEDPSDDIASAAQLLAIFAKAPGAKGILKPLASNIAVMNDEARYLSERTSAAGFVLYCLCEFWRIKEAGADELRRRLQLNDPSDYVVSMYRGCADAIADEKAAAFGPDAPETMRARWMASGISQL